VNETLGYAISIVDDPSQAVAELMSRSGVPRAIVLADRNVLARARIVAAAADADLLAFGLGERRKNVRTLARVLREIAALRADRRTLLIAVGGGVATDLFGFAASIYMRGVPFAAVATTVVGMADAAIGGKTGVDFAGAKNALGTFSDPVGVICDLGALETLGRGQLREGLAEVVKAAIITGDDAFARLEALAGTDPRAWPWAEVIAAAVDAKCRIVAQDRREGGIRELLNLGHTFAHAIESASDFSYSHGQAVAIGLRAAGLLGLERGSFPRTDHVRVVALLEAIGLPVRTRGLKARALTEAMRADKKARDGAVRFVVPRAIGDVVYGVVPSSEEIGRVLAALAKRPGEAERP
jgi:3-dehydroquinate synthetase